MRTRFLTKMVNKEVALYLEKDNLIFVPVGTVEMHGGLPLECETVISEAFALVMAEKTNTILLNNLPFFYAGATASGVGTTQVSIKDGINYLTAIAKSLLRQGFKRQIYLSFHGPAHMTCSPMVRDFFDETGVPILYLDLIMLIFKNAKELLKDENSFNAIIFGAYDILNRLDEIPLSSELDFDPSIIEEPSTKFAEKLFSLAYQSGSVGYYFGKETDHMPTPDIKTKEQRQNLANEGRQIINEIVNTINFNEIFGDLYTLSNFNEKVSEDYKHTPVNFNAKYGIK